MPKSSPFNSDSTLLITKLGVELDAELVQLALTHRSYAYENGGLPTNERLEFLGDSVLGLVVTDALYTSHPSFTEGQLAKLRASIVNMHALAGVAREIGLGSYLRLGRGEELTDGRDKASLLADAVEALLGAVYSQYGLETARSLIHRLFGDLIAQAPLVGAGLDWKTSLQERTATLDLGVPSYRITEEGPDHAKQFTATVVVAGDDRGSGTGKTKKEAEQKAAALAYGSLTPTLGAPEPDTAEPDTAEPDTAEPDTAEPSTADAADSSVDADTSAVADSSDEVDNDSPHPAGSGA